MSLVVDVETHVANREGSFTISTPIKTLINLLLPNISVFM